MFAYATYPVMISDSQASRLHDVGFENIRQWFRENIHGRYWAVSSRGTLVVGERDHENDRVIRHDTKGIYMFENKQDALLFKLVWGGES